MVCTASSHGEDNLLICRALSTVPGYRVSTPNIFAIILIINNQS